MPSNAIPPSEVPISLVDPRVMDPLEEIVARDHMSADSIEQVAAVLEAMSAWNESERAASKSAREYMKLGETDMKALRFLIAARNQSMGVTPGMIAQHLEVTPAAMTKILDRLESGGHVRRIPHEKDRRRLTIEVSDSTRLDARASIGRNHAHRFHAVASLAEEDRAAVLRFYRALMERSSDSGSTRSSTVGVTGAEGP